MATTKEVLLELEGIWHATVRADRRRRIEALYLGFGALVSGAFLVIGLGYIYTSLAGLR